MAKPETAEERLARKAAKREHREAVWQIRIARFTVGDEGPDPPAHLHAMPQMLRQWLRQRGRAD